ncbi:MAG: hypothetical protein HYR66_16085 [Sphingobacteriales bacterium]|nr:hypothetical protein [Sphingobacteriales bacterium]MBI3717727.1 hypothetical protein [Sphingobacteriales bacterium]
MDNVTIEQYLPEVFQLRKQGMELSQILLQLEKQNLSTETVNAIIQQWKKIYYAKKRNQGFIYVGVGTFLMVFSFLLSVFLFYSDNSIEWALYGITFVGLSLTFKGMVDILGW